MVFRGKKYLKQLLIYATSAFMFVDLRKIFDTVNVAQIMNKLYEMDSLFVYNNTGNV